MKKFNRMEKSVIVRCYKSQDNEELFALIEREGEDWKAYWQGSGRLKYQKALANCINYVLLEEKERG